ncbi:MAG: hypothetical protein HQK92_13320 [Nitrospirae bacterium]|nr:hypothetical protein [Nitrospirota bacterium]
MDISKSNKGFSRNAMTFLFTLLALVIFSDSIYGASGSTDNTSGTMSSAMTLGGSSDDVAYTIAKTSDGGFIIGGYTESFGQGKRDILLVKMNKLNEIDWQYTYGGADIDNVQSVKQTTDGGYIAAGYTKSFGAGGFDMWVLKLNSNGQITWQYTYGGSDTDYAKSVEQTTDGGYIVLGYTGSSGAGLHDIWVLKLNPDGTIKWQKTYGTPDVENSYAIRQTSDGGYIISGNKVRVSDDIVEILFIKLDSDGLVKWSKTYGKGGQSFSFSTQETTDGGYIVSGYSNAFGAGGMDVWVFKLNKSGDTEWQKSYGGTGNDYAYSVIQTSDGGYLVTGSTNSFGSGGYDMWVLKLKSEGSIAWQNAYGGKNDDSATSYSAYETASWGYIVSGNTKSYGVGGADFWVVTIASDGTSGTFTTKTNATAANTDVIGKDVSLKQITTTVLPALTNVSAVRSSVVVGNQK